MKARLSKFSSFYFLGLYIDILILASFCWTCQCPSWMVSAKRVFKKKKAELYVCIEQLGFGATLEIRNIESRMKNESSEIPRSRILALTGRSSIEDKRRAFEAGVDG